MVSIAIATSQSDTCGFITFGSCNILIDPFQAPIDNLDVTLNYHLINNLHWLYIDVILLTRPNSLEALTSATNGYDINNITIIGTRFIIDSSNIESKFKRVVKLSFEESHRIEFEHVSKRLAKYYFLSKPLVLEFTPHSSGYSLGSAWYSLENFDKGEKIAILTPISESYLFKTPSIDTLCEAKIILSLINNSVKIKKEPSAVNKQPDKKNLILSILKKCEGTPLSALETNIFSPSLLYFLVDFFNNCVAKHNKNIYILDESIKKYFNLLNQACEWVSNSRSEPTMNANPQPPFHDITSYIGTKLFLCENNAELNNLLAGSSILIKHNESVDLFNDLLPPLIDLNFDKSQKVYTRDSLNAKLEDILPEWLPGSFNKITNGSIAKNKTLVNATLSIKSDPIAIDDSEAVDWGLNYKIGNLSKLANALGGTLEAKTSRIIIDNCTVTVHSPNAVEITAKDVNLRRKITKIIEKFR